MERGVWKIWEIVSESDEFDEYQMKAFDYPLWAALKGKYSGKDPEFVPQCVSA